MDLTQKCYWLVSKSETAFSQKNSESSVQWSLELASQILQTESLAIISTHSRPCLYSWIEASKSWAAYVVEMKKTPIKNLPCNGSYQRDGVHHFENISAFARATRQTADTQREKVLFKKKNFLQVSLYNCNGVYWHDSFSKKQKNCKMIRFT